MQDLTLRVDHSGFSIYLQVRIYDQPKQTVNYFHLCDNMYVPLILANYYMIWYLVTFFD